MEKKRDRDHDWRDKKWDHDRYIPPYDRQKVKNSNTIDPESYKKENVLGHILIRVESGDKILKEMKIDFFQLQQQLSHI